MTKIIDFHTHAFADDIAEKTMETLGKACPDVEPELDGTIADLLRSMEASGIQKSVICSIATKPKHFEPILKWSKQIASEKIIPFASIHPDDTLLAEKIEQVKDAGIKGLKIHPYYQDFCLDENKMMKYYEKVCDADMIIVSHTGYDIAFPFIKKAEPQRVINVITKFPELKFIATHLGAWQAWDEVQEFLLGKKVYMELSMAFGFLAEDKIKNILSHHPAEYLLFGSDSPWAGQKKTINALKKLGLDSQRQKKILYKNAERLLRN